ncbi:MAG: hypothetical protein Q4A98_02415 [Comamonadaceae bacterium]|nr:hypothetical protein [Comamonadaceae bacterium]
MAWNPAGLSQPIHDALEHLRGEGRFFLPNTALQHFLHVRYAFDTRIAVINVAFVPDEFVISRKQNASIIMVQAGAHTANAQQ